MTPKTLAKKIAHQALTKKANNVLLLDVRKLTDIADFFVVASGDSDVQVKAIADAIDDGMAQLGVQSWHREGLTERQWVLLDYVDVVCHVFHREARAFYALEKLWGDAAIEHIEDVLEKPVTRKRAAKPQQKGRSKIVRKKKNKAS